MRYRINPITGELDLVGGFSIGDSVSGGTSNRVLYIDGSGNVAVNDNFQFDGSTVTLAGDTGILSFGNFGTMYGDSFLELIKVTGGFYTTGNFYNVTNNVVNPVSIIRTVSSPGTGYSMVSLSDTWNGTGTYNAFKLNVINTASNAASTIADIQLNSNSKFRINDDGTVDINADLSVTGQSTFDRGAGGTAMFIQSDAQDTLTALLSLRSTSTYGNTNSIYQEFHFKASAGGYQKFASINAYSLNATSATLRGGLGFSTVDTSGLCNEFFRLNGLNNRIDYSYMILLKAGSTAAGTAPLKFQSGSLLTAPEVGALEFLTDSLYFTQTTSTKRKKISFEEDSVVFDFMLMGG